MDLPRLELLEESGDPPSRPGGGDPMISGGLGEVEHGGAVGEHGRAGLSEVELAGVDLGEVRDEFGLRGALLLDEPLHLVDQGIVGEVMK
jgi:hypothetical protein